MVIDVRDEGTPFSLPPNLVCLGDVLPHDLVVPPAEHDNAAAVSGQDHAVSDAPPGASSSCCLVTVTSLWEAEQGM